MEPIKSFYYNFGFFSKQNNWRKKIRFSRSSFAIDSKNGRKMICAVRQIIFRYIIIESIFLSGNGAVNHNY